jgi:hypothetical protein
VLIDPSSGAERSGGDLWRPVVDPTASHAVAWSGTVPGPRMGRSSRRPKAASNCFLVVGDGGVPGRGVTQVISDAPVTDFDVRWDETGTWFATWVADPSGTEVGRLSLYRVDPATGRLEQPGEPRGRGVASRLLDR